MTKKKIVYIDIDGVLADYDLAFKEAIKNKPENKYPQSEYGFFLNLPLIKNAKPAVDYIDRNFNMFFLSAPSTKNPWSYTEKRLWIEKHFGIERVDKLILSRHKYLNKGDYLIDDRKVNKNHLFEGKFIHFRSREFSTWLKVIEYFHKINL